MTKMLVGRPTYHILDDNNNMIQTDRDQWVDFSRTGKQNLLRTDFDDNDIIVRTIYLMVNTVMPFETIVCSSDKRFDGISYMYKTHKEAIKGHFNVINMIQETLGIGDKRKRRILNFKLNG